MGEAGARHVFLSHNARDKAQVEALARQLLDRGLRPWLDKWEIRAGCSWQQALQEAIEGAAAVLVCVGAHGLGRVQRPEVEIALERALRDSARQVLLVFLPGAPPQPELPAALRRRSAIDLRSGQAGYWQLFAALGGGRAQTARGAQDSPFRALEAFEERHARWFFGREAYLARLLTALRERRLLVLIGASGSGKSSLVRAGLLPAVRTGELDPSYEWVPLLLRPGPHPLHALAQCLAGALGAQRDAAALLAGLVREPGLLADELDREAVRGPRELRFLLVVDPFEEVFALCAERAQREAFIAALLQAAHAPGGRTHVAWALRADFVPQLLEHPGLAQRLHQTHVLLGAMSPAELRAAIRRPALIAGLELEPGLEDLLLQDVAGEPGALPLLQFALEQLWQQREGRRLTLAAYQRIGGIQGALAQRADAALAELDPAQRALVRRLFGRLVQPGEGSPDTRRRIDMGELLASRPELRAPLESLIEHRLLTVDEQQVEVAHEALIREWATLREWIAADRALVRLQLELARAAARWQQSAQDSELWGGARLARTLELRAAGELTLAAPEEAFLDAAAAHLERQAQRQREHRERELEAARALARVQTSAARRLRAGLAGAVLLLVAVAGAAHRARTEQGAAERSRAAVQQTIEDAFGVADLLLQAAEDELREVVGASAIRREILRRGAALLDRLQSAVDAPTRVKLLRRRADFHRKQAALAWTFDDLPWVRSESEAELALRAQLARAAPGDTGAQLDWANAYQSLASRLRIQGELPQARAALEQSLQIASRLAEREPDQFLIEVALSNCLRQLGHLAREEGEAGAARSHYERALQVVRRMAARPENAAEGEGFLSLIHQDLGELALDQEDFTRARSYLERTQTFLLEEARREPDSLSAQSSLLLSYTALGELEWAAGEPERGRAAYQAALRIAERLVQQDPAQPYLRTHHAQALIALGRLERSFGHRAAARSLYAQAVAALEPLQDSVTAYAVGALAVAYGALAVLAQDEGHAAQALEWTERFRAQKQRAAREPGPRDVALARYSESRFRAQLALQRGQLAAARAGYEQWIAELDELNGLFPAAPGARLARSIALADRCELAAAQGRFAEASSLCGDALRAAQDSAGNEPLTRSLRLALAQRHQQLALVEQAQGRSAAALAHLERALSLREEDAAEAPRDGEAQRERARAHAQLAAALRGAERPARASEQLQRALELQRRRLREDPDDEHVRLDAARTLAQRAELARAQGRLGEARRAHDEALALLAPLVQAESASPAAQRALALAQRERAHTARAQGELAQAHAWLERSAAALETLARSDPDDVALARELALAHHSLGELTQAQGELAAAGGLRERAAESLRALLEREPGEFASRRALLEVYEGLASLQQALGPPAPVRSTLARARALAEQTLELSPGSAQAQRDATRLRERVEPTPQ